MSPPEWATTRQTEFLNQFLEPYMQAKANQEAVPLTRFWNRLENAYFTEFPAEDLLKRPPPVEGVPLLPLTPEEDALVGAATALTKERLKAWMRYRERRINPPTISSQGGRSKGLFKRLAKRSSRPLRAVELYQRIRHAKIKAAVMLRGYEDLTDSEEDAAVTAAAGGGPVAAAEVVDKKRKRALRAARMSLWQTTARELFEEEPDDVKAEMVRLTQEENIKRGLGAPPDTEDAMSPEALQFAIDQIGAVFAKVHEMTLTQTGWMGFTMLGGPMPRRKGEISIKTICFGQSANGNDFAAALPGFDTSIKVPFGQWLKQVFSHDIRDARMLKAIDGEDIAMDAETDVESDDDVSMPKLPQGLLAMAPLADAPQPKASASKSKRRDTRTSTSKSKGKESTPVASTLLQAPTRTPSVTTPQLRLTPTSTSQSKSKETVPVASMPVQAPTRTPSFTTPQLRLRTPESTVPDSPFDSLGDLTANDFGGESQFDYNTAFSEVLARGNENTPASPASPAPLVPLVPVSTFPPPFTSMNSSQNSAGPLASSPLTFGSGSTPSSPFGSSVPSSPPEAVPRFVFGTNPPFSFGCLSSSPTHTLSASALPSPSADHQALPGVASATLTHAVIQPAFASTSARPRPKPLRPTALQRFNAALAANANGSVVRAPASATPTPPAPTTSITTTSPPTAVTTTPAPAILASPIPTAPIPVAPPAAVSPDPVPMTVVPVAGPQYVQSRPMANPPQGHALVPAPPAAKKRGRPRKTPVPEVGEDENGGPGPQQAMSAAARAESARINKVATALRKQTAEQLKRSREMEVDAGEAAGTKRAHPDVGISVVQRPKRAAKALLNADGTEIVRPVKGRRGELRSGEHLGGRFDHDAAQEQADTEMGEQLRSGKREAAKTAASKAPAGKRARA